MKACSILQGTNLDSIVAGRIIGRAMLLGVGLCLALAGASSADSPPDIRKLLEAAQPGQTVQLPEGTFRTSLVLPEGVSLRGAGYDKTILETGGAALGVAVSGGGHVRIEDLTVRAQGTTALDIEKSADVTVARELAFRPATALSLRPKPAHPRITIRKLPGPLPIDGRLDKWRGITPQIVMTPVTSTSIASPSDASAVIRLAYHDRDLYVQILRFDDVVSFHQPATKTHLQDTMEMALNGFFEGFQFSVSRYTDTGPAIVRRRFYFQNLEERLTPEHAPRYVEVLPDAKEVRERQLIESIYGEDLSACQVIVTEFKLPIDKTTYARSEESLFPVRSGSGVWIGFMIDDNDVPGTDRQKMIVWPATYGTFNVKEAGAYAVFE